MAKIYVWYIGNSITIDRNPGGPLATLYHLRACCSKSVLQVGATLESWIEKIYALTTYDSCGPILILKLVGSKLTFGESWTVNWLKTVWISTRLLVMSNPCIKGESILKEINKFLVILRSSITLIYHRGENQFRTRSVKFWS